MLIHKQPTPREFSALKSVQRRLFVIMHGTKRFSNVGTQENLGQFFLALEVTRGHN